jgi:8-oxo-dGTP pyrophosphatase MutT (NUDIX family)
VPITVLSGPSGVGKGTVIRELLRLMPGLTLSISYTTRAPRPGEQGGVDYHFRTRAEFVWLIDKGYLLEWAGYGLDLYGTPWPPDDEHVLIENDIQIPGGKIDELVDGKIVRSGRSAEDTVVREIKEELSVDIEIAKKLGDREFSEDTYVMHYTWYLGKITDDSEPAIGEPDKYDGLRYFSQDDLGAIISELSPNTVNFLEAWRTHEFTLI